MVPNVANLNSTRNKKLNRSIRALLITSEWPDKERIHHVPFLVQQVKYLSDAGVDITVFHFRGKKNPINYLKAWLKLRLNYDLKSYDLIHAHFGQSGLIAIPTGLPLIVTFHGSDLQGIWGPKNHYTFRGRILNVASRIVARYADQIILVSEHMSQYLPRWVNYHVIPGGVNTDLFVPLSQTKCREKLSLPLNKPLILFCGLKEDPCKRYDLAKEAIEILKKQLDVEFLCVNNVAHENMPAYVNAADVLLLTSKHEGSPSIVKEALACNCPIVAVDVGDLRERISHTEGCFLCSDDSPTTIAGNIRKAIASKRDFKSRSCVEQLDETIISKRIIQIYESVLGRN
jgi:teichuronic acid biosynthesis glycosyltransferase TuaC